MARPNRFELLIPIFVVGVIRCPNQDVAYGAGFMTLDKEPIVFQVPDFGNRFWVYAHYDARTDELSEIGEQYGTKPGFYMMVGPNWKGDKPANITAVVRSSTSLVFAVPRIFVDDSAEDQKAVQPTISRSGTRPASPRTATGCRTARCLQSS